MGGYIQTMKKVCLKERFVKSPVSYRGGYQRVLATETLRSAGEKRNSFILDSFSGEEN